MRSFCSTDVVAFFGLVFVGLVAGALGSLIVLLTHNDGRGFESLQRVPLTSGAVVGAALLRLVETLIGATAFLWIARDFGIAAYALAVVAFVNHVICAYLLCPPRAR